MLTLESRQQLDYGEEGETEANMTLLRLLAELVASTLANRPFMRLFLFCVVFWTLVFALSGRRWAETNKYSPLQAGISAPSDR